MLTFFHVAVGISILKLWHFSLEIFTFLPEILRLIFVDGSPSKLRNTQVFFLCRMYVKCRHLCEAIRAI